MPESVDQKESLSNRYRLLRQWKTPMRKMLSSETVPSANMNTQFLTSSLKLRSSHATFWRPYQWQVCKYTVQENTSDHTGSHSLETDMQQIDCEVDTGSSCNILPLYKAREIFKQEWLSLDQLTVYIQAFGGQTVRNLGSCVVYMHIKGKIYKVRCEVTKTPGHLILGREQAKIIGYVGYPQTQPPTGIANPKITHTALKLQRTKRSLPKCTQKTKDQMEWNHNRVRGQNTQSANFKRVYPQRIYQCIQRSR